MNASADPVSHWVPKLDIHGIGQDWQFDRMIVPYELVLSGSLVLVVFLLLSCGHVLYYNLLFRLTEGKTAYFPIVDCKNMQVFNRDLLVSVCQSRCYTAAHMLL